MLFNIIKFFFKLILLYLLFNFCLIFLFGWCNNSKLNAIRQTYANKYSQYQLLDYIYDKNTKKLIKVWDHKTNDLNSITAGLPGIHNYFVIQGDKKILIGKFIR